jgi:hypothetical protein
VHLMLQVGLGVLGILLALVIIFVSPSLAVDWIGVMLMGTGVFMLVKGIISAVRRKPER